MAPAELIRPLASRSAKPRSQRMQSAVTTSGRSRAQLMSEKVKTQKQQKPRSDIGKKRVKKITKIAWYEGARWYEVKNQWIKLDDDNVSVCCLYLLIAVIGTCLSTF